MRRGCVSFVLAVACAALVTAAGGLAQSRHLNPVIDLLAQKKPVFGVYAPGNGSGRGRAAPAPPRPAIELAKDALGYGTADFLFNGSMEGGVDRALPAVADFVTAMGTAGTAEHLPFLGLTRPLILKTPKIA